MDQQTPERTKNQLRTATTADSIPLQSSPWKTLSSFPSPCLSPNTQRECPLPRNPVRHSWSLFSLGKSRILFSSSGNLGASCREVTFSALQRHA